jgi:hypothetical protein
MNAQQLRRNIGQAFRLRPVPQRADVDGRRLPEIDDRWRLEEARDKPTCLRLKNIATGHVVELQSDNINRFQSPDYLILRCQLTLTELGVQIEPLIDSGSGSLPIAAYQGRVRPMSTVRLTPFIPQICNGCTAAVQYRPLTAVRLLDSSDPRCRSEQFCPNCARKRGIFVLAPEGMTDAVLYAEHNPTLRYHVTRLLKASGLRALSADSELRGRGVTNVGAAISGHWLTLIVSGPTEVGTEVTVSFAEMESDGIASELDLLSNLTARIVRALTRR